MAQAKRRRKRKIFSPVYLTLVLIVLYLPILMVVIYSFNSGRTIGSWQGFTTDWYSRLFSNALMADALKNSLVLAVVSSLLAGGIGTLGAIGLARSHLKLGGAVETIATLPMMIPELVLGMAYLSVFTAVGFKLGMGALVLTHTTFCIPYVFINVKSRLIGMDPSLSEAARDLGASPARVLKDITLPLIFPAVLSGMMLSAAMSLCSGALLEDAGYLVATLILLLFILLGILFDIIGVAVTAANPKPFNSMAAHRVKGAKEALYLIRNAEKVASFCNDVVGDICGIVSGSTATVIVVLLQNSFGWRSIVVSTVVTALISGLTIGGKAIGKKVAMKKSKDVIYLAARLLSVLHLVR